MPRLYFSTDLNKIIEVLFWNLKTENWLIKQGYGPKLPDLPKELKRRAKKSKILTRKLRLELYTVMLPDYAATLTKLRKEKRKLQKSWNKISKNYFKLSEEIIGENFPNRLHCLASPYSSGGFYYFPNQIVINPMMKYPIDTVIHELTHILIEPYIQKGKLTHNQKERLVDLYLYKTELKRLQKRPELQKRGDKSIDKVFKGQTIKQFLKDWKSK